MHEVRKTVTVLFADVVSSTQLGERLDAEAHRGVVSRYFAEMAGVVEAHGGTVEKFIGDEVMAVFGVPMAHEDDALRAVRAAVAMQERLASLNDELEERWAARLEIRIGVNTGDVMAGDPSSGHGFVTGDAVTLGKRLEQAAAPGDVLIGETTARLVSHAVTATAVEPLSVKGKQSAVRAHRVTGIDPSSEALPRRFDAPLVGRSTELNALRYAYARALETRRPQLVTVLGTAGIGKSRLARELLDEVRHEARVLRGRCLPYGEGITFWPVRDIMPGETFDGTTEEIFWRVRARLQEIADEQPLVVCFEDVHWGEPTFLDLVQYLAGWMRDAPVVLLCLARPELLERRADWAATGADTMSLRLGRLSDGDTAALLEHLGSVPDLEPQITRAAEGNPLFVEQMAAMALDQGGSIAVPDSIRALLTARLDRLDPIETAVVQRAAVIGREFPLRAVVDLSPAELRPSVAAHLFGLVRKELVRPQVDGDDDRFRFRHALIRDAAYDGIPKTIRAELHERHATWLEEGGTSQVIAGYHLEQAVRLRRELGLSDAATDRLAIRAGELLGEAGRQAYRRGDMPAARGLLERTLGVMPEAADTLGLRGLLANAMWQVGDVGDAEDLLRAVCEDASKAGDRGQEWSARLDLAMRRTVQGAGAAELSRTAERAIAVFEELGDEASLARARRALGIVSIRAGRYGDAEQHLERAFAAAPETLGPAERARSADALCTALFYGPAEASRAASRCRALLEDTGGNLVLEANVASSLAGLVAMLESWDESRALYGRARQLFEELGLRMPLAGLTQVVGAIELLAGEPVAAERELRMGLEILSSTGARGLIAPQAAFLASSLVAQDRLDEANELVQLAETAMSTEDLPSLIVVRTVRSQLCSALGDSSSGVDAAAAAISVAERTDALNLTADAYVALAHALDALGASDDVASARTAALDLHRRKGNRAAIGRLGTAGLFVTDRTR